MNDLGPIQRQVLEGCKEYYHLHPDRLITCCDMVDYTGMKHMTIKKAMDQLAKKQRLRRISPKRGYGLLV